VQRLRRAGARIRVQDRWSRAVSADVDSAVAERIAHLRDVVALYPVRQLRLTRLPLPLPLPLPSAAVDSFYGLSFSALSQLNIPAAHALGFNGRTVRIGMLDAGFDRTHEATAPIKVLAQYDFIYNDTIVRNQPRDTFNQASHGTATLSIVGGYKPGTLVGAAYGASFLLAKTEVDNPALDQHQDEDRWVAGAQWEDSVGVDIISSSLGYRGDFPDSANRANAPMVRQPDGTWQYPCSDMNGRTTQTSIAASKLARSRILLVNAMGNDGPGACTLGAPADADSILSVGAVDSLGVVASFSSRGPTGDNRPKPELVARGVRVPHAVSGSGTGYLADSGTSFATPLIAGAAALVLQAWPNLSPIAIRQALVLSAPRAVPDNNVGYGIPDVGSAIVFPQGLGIAGVSPTDALGQANSIAPTFSWVAPGGVNQAAGLVVYRVDVATDSAFHGVVYSDTITNAFQLTARLPLRPANALYWRVVASAGSAIQRRTLTAGPFIVPHWVRLANLNDVAGSFTSTSRPVLQWVQLTAPPPAGPLHFDVQILGASGGSLQTLTDISADSVKLVQSLDFDTPYRWRVIARAANGTADTVTSVGAFKVSVDTLPPSTTLYQNFPNPFPRNDLGVNDTRIWFDLHDHGPVDLAVYDMRGRLVRRLIPAAGCPAVELGPGSFGRTPAGDPCIRTTWDGTDDQGHLMPRGVYLLRLRAAGTSQTRHIVFTP
jgi:hypothetical protein